MKLLKWLAILSKKIIKKLCIKKNVKGKDKKNMKEGFHCIFQRVILTDLVQTKNEYCYPKVFSEKQYFNKDIDFYSNNPTIQNLMKNIMMKKLQTYVQKQLEKNDKFIFKKIRKKEKKKSFQA